MTLRLCARNSVSVLSKAKVVKKTKEPKTRCSGTMTESQFLAWVRSALRSKSLRWLPRTQALQLARRPYIGPNKLQKYEVMCSLCKQWGKIKDHDVDHYPKSAGSILSIDDLGEFINNLYCETNNLRVLCKSCHSIHTLSELAGITFEQARFEKDVNEKMKLPAKELLTLLSTAGYTDASVSNVTKRRQAVSAILKEKQNGTNN